MQLDYLLFDFTDDESGAGSFAAMASVLPDRICFLVEEVATVLRWAHREFGAPAAPQEAGEWDFDLHCATEADTPLPVSYDAARGKVFLEPAAEGRSTLTLTLAGSRAFCAAFAEAFSISGC